MLADSFVVLAPAGCDPAEVGPREGGTRAVACRTVQGQRPVQVIGRLVVTAAPQVHLTEIRQRVGLTGFFTHVREQFQGMAVMLGSSVITAAIHVDEREVRKCAGLAVQVSGLPVQGQRPLEMIDSRLMAALLELDIPEVGKGTPAPPKPRPPMVDRARG